MFIPRFLLLLLTFLLGTAFAAPTLHSRSLEDALSLTARSPTPAGRIPAPHLQKFKHAAVALHTIHKVKAHLKPKPSSAVFWSGTHKVNGHPTSVHAAAQKFAHDHHKSTINHGLAQHGIRIPEAHQNPYSAHIWEAASKVWAQRASGHTHVVLGGTVRPESAYRKVERPVLMRNRRVTMVTEHIWIHTGKSTVSKGRKRANTI